MSAAAIPNPIFADRRERSRPPQGERPIDLVHLARATDGDESLEAELLSMFYRQSEKLAERVKFAGLARRARADIAHLLRGSALAIGAFEVASSAGALEAAFEAEAEPVAELAALGAAVAKARAAIAEWDS
jgi:HPt (histidine-containing phosphotransfer) domain-containing protein